MHLLLLWPARQPSAAVLDAPMRAVVDERKFRVVVVTAPIRAVVSVPNYKRAVVGSPGALKTIITTYPGYKAKVK